MLSFKRELRMRAHRMFLTAVFAVVTFCFWPSSAQAQTTMGDVVCNVIFNGMTGYTYLINVAAWIMGAFLALRSMLLLKRHADNPQQAPLAPAIGHLFAGGALASFPAFTGVISETFFAGSTGGGGAEACDPAAVAAADGSVGLDIIMVNFVGNLHQPIFMLLSIIGFAVGATFLVQALLRASKSGMDPRAADPKMIITNLIFGGVLMSLSFALPDMLTTLFGDGGVHDMGTTTSIIQWSSFVGAGVDTTSADRAMRAVLAFIQIVGGISFLRGWLLLKKAVEGGQATIPQGLTHIIAGAMCMNIDTMLAVFDESFGTNLIG